MEGKQNMTEGSKDSYILQIMIRSKKEKELCKDDVVLGSLQQMPISIVLKETARGEKLKWNNYEINNF